MTRIAFLLLLFAGTSAHAQDSVAPIADSLRAAGDFKAAIAAYKDALARVDSGAHHVAYSLAATYALEGQQADSAFHYLDRSLSQSSSVRPLYDPDFHFLTRDERWTGVQDRGLDHLAEEVGPGFDRFYAQELLSARLREWAYRWHIMFAFRTLGPESPILTALADAMQANHARNETTIFRLLDERGWPLLSRVGPEAAYAAGNLVNHAALDVRQRYLPVLEAACRDGEADWSEWAHILDRTELELGRPQVYGTQMEQNPASGLFEPRPMVDPERVDERRAEKGMEPLQDQLDRFNLAMKRDFGG